MRRHISQSLLVLMLVAFGSHCYLNAAEPICENETADQGREAEITGKAKIRAKPSLQGKVLGSIPDKSIVDILKGPCGPKRDWYEILFKDRQGYLHAKSIRRIQWNKTLEGLDQIESGPPAKLSDVILPNGMDAESYRIEMCKKHPEKLNPDMCKDQRK